VKNASLQKVYIETLGCQMNVYDSAKIADVLHSSFSVEKTDYPEEAHFTGQYLLSTGKGRRKIV